MAGGMVTSAEVSKQVSLWVASFDGPISAFLATLLILYFCCVLVQVLLLCGK